MYRHGSEPAVSLTYSDKSSTNATISLGVGDEMTRDSYHPGSENDLKSLFTSSTSELTLYNNSFFRTIWK